MNINRSLDLRTDRFYEFTALFTIPVNLSRDVDINVNARLSYFGKFIVNHHTVALFLLEKFDDAVSGLERTLIALERFRGVELVRRGHRFSLVRCLQSLKHLEFVIKSVTQNRNPARSSNHVNHLLLGKAQR